MNDISTACPRLLVLRMDHGQTLELAKVAGGVLGGALGLRLFDRVFAHWRKKQREPVELTARILDDGDKFRELLLAENQKLRAEKDAALERAHAAELKLAVTANDLTRLGSRLDRKDEACKALQAQLIQLGQTPVILFAPAGREESPR